MSGTSLKNEKIIYGPDCAPSKADAISLQGVRPLAGYTMYSQGYVKKTHTFVNLRRAKDLQKYVKSWNRLEYKLTIARKPGNVKMFYEKGHVK